MRKEREIQYLFLGAARCAKLGFPLVNLHQRFAICAGMARVFALQHANHVVFGDLNAKNALFTVGPGRHEADVMMVDCDAVRVRGTMTAVPQLNAPDWEPPLAERTQLTHQTDVHKYALFVLRCLSPGSNASTARDPRRVADVLDSAGQALMSASFSETPGHRPGAAQWADYFAGVRAPRARVPPRPGHLRPRHLRQRPPRPLRRGPRAALPLLPRPPPAPPDGCAPRTVSGCAPADADAAPRLAYPRRPGAGTGGRGWRSGRARPGHHA